MKRRQAQRRLFLGTYGSHPYVLLNFHGTINDVFTLAHEMGHSIHTWYSDRNQPVYLCRV